MEQIKFYRIKNTFNNDGVELYVEEWCALRPTPQGYWIAKKGYPEWMDEKRLRKAGYVRWVSNGNYSRRYCYPSIEEAMQSFLARKEHELLHARLKFEACQMMVDKAADLKKLTLDDFKTSWGALSHQLERVDAMDSFNWE